RGRAAAPWLAAAVGVVAFPFLYAMIPAAGYWEDGRYGVMLPSLLVLLLALALVGPPVAAAGAEAGTAAGMGSGAGAGTGNAPGNGGGAGRRGRHARHARSARGARRGLPTRPAAARGPGVVGRLALLLAGGGLVVGTGLTVATSRAGGVPTSPRSFFSGWTDPNTSLRRTVVAMEAHGIRYAYGTYWTAYDLDFLAPTRLSVSPSPVDVDRWPALAAQVAAAPQQAWLFFAPGQEAAAMQAIGGNTEPGPGGFTEPRFVGLLEADHVPYRVVHLGVLDAVIPARRFELPG